MKKIWQACKAYPIAVVFFVFLMGFSVLDALWPKRAHSELENRDLAQKPQFSIASVVSRQNPWMVQYEAYVKDQFAFRDGWIDLKSYAEAALLKTENNDVYYGSGNYLFKQLLGVDESRFARNVTALANLCERHPGMVDAMIVPSASLVLKDKLPANAPGLDENAHLDEMYSAVQAAGGNVFDMRETLGSHAEEYIFYRTDHHWTSLGAYYGYTGLATALGYTPVPLNDYTETVRSTEFYGTVFSSSGVRWVRPDTISTYVPDDGITVASHTYDNKGNPVEEPRQLYDTSFLSVKDKYSMFLGGNQPLGVVKNANNPDGPRLLIIRDSYADSLVPFLTPHFSEIHLLDLRYYKLSIADYIAQNGIDQALVLYSVPNFVTDSNLLWIAK